MAQDGGQQGAKCHPKCLRESLVSLGARQLSPKMRPREARAGAWSILASAFGGPRGSKLGPRADQKWYRKHVAFRSRFGTDFSQFGGAKSITFGSSKRTQVQARVARRIRKLYGKNLIKINTLQLAFGQFLKKKNQKNCSGEGAKIQCDFLSILVYFGPPSGVDFGPKTVPKRCPKPSAKMKVSRSVIRGLRRSRSAPAISKSAPGRLQVSSE